MPSPLPHQLTDWLDGAIHAAAPHRFDPYVTPYEIKCGISLVLQSCFPGVVALEVKTQGVCSNETMTRRQPVVQAGSELFRVLDQSPWLENDSIERMHVEQREKLMQHASIQPDLDMKTMVVAHWHVPLIAAKEEPTSQWAQAIGLHMQASVQAEFLRSNGKDVQASAARSKPPRL